MASSKVSNLTTYNIGTNNSSLSILASLCMATMVGSTKNPLRSFNALPPYNILPPYFLISSRPSSYSLMAEEVWSGPQRVPYSSGSPILIVPYALTRLLTTLS